MRSVSVKRRVVGEPRARHRFHRRIRADGHAFESQRYDRQGPGRLRYVDLGLSRSFEADLVVDDAGLVLRYEHLFERVAPPA